MIFLVLATIFGALVLILTFRSFMSGFADKQGKEGSVGRFPQILKFLIIVESVIFVVIFIILLIRTFAV